MQKCKCQNMCTNLSCIDNVYIIVYYSYILKCLDWDINSWTEDDNVSSSFTEMPLSLPLTTLSMVIFFK